MRLFVTIARIVAIAVSGIIMGFIALVSIPFETSGRVYFWTGYFWSKISLRICRVKVHVTGMENIDYASSYIFVTNHASMSDIPALMSVLPRLRIMFKKELSYVPIWGWAMRWGRHVMVDRARGGEAMKSIDKAAAAIRSGDSIILFAEGTRTRDGKLQPFKRGAFSLAAKSGVPIVPITINGSYGVLPRHSFTVVPSTIELVINPPISTLNIKSRTEELALMETVRNIIASQYVEP
jgi:1-acyl-sn-glycerol-3-phosphate acyltransferase